MNQIEKIIKDKTLTYEQKVIALARHAENSVQVLHISEETTGILDSIERLTLEGVYNGST